MLNFCSLYSGSSGNCLFVETEKTKILVDCGTSLKKVVTGLSSIDRDIKDIDAILIKKLLIKFYIWRIKNLIDIQ